MKRDLRKFVDFTAGEYDQLILEPEDWSKEEWATILKLFGLEEAEKIEISNYKMRALGVRKGVK